MIAFLKRKYPYILLSLFSFAISFLLLEIGYRVYRYQDLLNGYKPYALIGVEQPLYRFDAELGYRYIPDTRTNYLWFDDKGMLLAQHEIKINNLGWVSGRDYTEEKPEGEFRVALLGDSYTASVSTTIPWADTLEDQLNADQALKDRLGVDHFRVLNFGQEHTGFVQYATLFRLEAQHFDPDLVIVTYISNDFIRRFLWRDTMPAQGDHAILLSCFAPPVAFDNERCYYAQVLQVDPSAVNDPDHMQTIMQQVYTQRVKGLPWSSLHSEFIATLRKEPQLKLVDSSPDWYSRSFYSPEEGWQASLAALDEIAAGSPRLMLFRMTYYAEIQWGQTPETTTALMQHFPDLTLQQPFLDQAQQVDDAEIQSWFNLPYDDHLSDHGAEVWADLIYQQVVGELEN